MSGDNLTPSLARNQIDFIFTALAMAMSDDGESQDSVPHRLASSYPQDQACQSGRNRLDGDGKTKL